jgi:hypothetical protein
LFTTNNYLDFSTVIRTTSEAEALTAEALRAYRLARVRSWLGRQWAALTGHSRSLKALSGAGEVSSRRFAGTRPVRIRQIRGSEDRSQDFDIDFNPLGSLTQARWVSVFAAWQAGVTLPPVELIRLGDTYYVRDGHHPISVARALGQEYIDAG